MKKAIVVLFMQLLALPMIAQINTDRVLAIGRNALYFEDYVLSIQYFNQVIRSKPWLAEPYFYRAVAKINLEDYSESLPVFLTMIMMPLAYSISEGIAFGMLSFVFIKIFTGKWKQISILMYILAVFFIIKLLL